MKLTLDIDSTLWPLIDAMALVEGGSRCSYEVCDSWGALIELCDAPLFDVLDRAMHPEVAHSIGVYPGAREQVEALHSEGVEIHVVTHRPERMLADTEAFLAEFGIPYDRLIVSHDIDKVQHCLDHEIGVIVDDAPHIFRAAHEAEMTALSLDHLYLRPTATELGAELCRDWNEIGERIRTALGLPQPAPVA